MNDFGRPISTASAPLSERTPTVIAEMDSLQSSFSNLLDRFNGLCSRLTPVLREEPPSEVCEKAQPAPRPNMSPVAYSVVGLRNGILQLNERIAELINRLEV